MLDWFPIVFFTFKAIIFGTGMFLAIKWHYEQKRKGRVYERGAVLRVAGKAAAVVVIFGLLLTGLLIATFALSRKIGLDLS
ncbi:hypothetical protein [Luteibacter aegosomatissinici]|uniref:hypothetical protein n=1 Tax=Luteibacter aegosomatissinici TaxID=2911539 RepID=UPI001FFB1852|nr:hypothetical protein [Luteibacter aegosomatissinici]UPG92634.1 hypothetical protein L2Y97_12220 [Luteibacter aegosomatissinici]